MAKIGEGLNIPQNLTVAQNENKNDPIPENVKEDYQKINVVDTMEKAEPAPASSGRARKIIAGIVGALLTAVGIAAAAASVLATAGISLGIMAGAAAFVGGITGTSIIAGVSGCAGIGLIAGSARMKVNPQGLENAAKNTESNHRANNDRQSILENLAGQQGNIIDDNKINVKKVNVKKTGSKQVKSNQQIVYDIDSKLQTSKKSSSIIGEKQRNSISSQLQKMGVTNPEKLSADADLMSFFSEIEYSQMKEEYEMGGIDHTSLSGIAENVLELPIDAPATELNQKNVLKVRMAFNNFFATGEGAQFPDSYNSGRDALNNLQFKQKLSEALMRDFEENGMEITNVGAYITFAALFMDDISKLPKG